MNNYDSESYWDKVARSIESRESETSLAGDDEPYYRYKRRLFLKLFNTIHFQNRKVLEVGCGPGGNLDILTQKGCSEIVGVDISEKMIALARAALTGKEVVLQKIDGWSLPFDDDHFDIVFTSAVLQHDTNEVQLRQLVSNICRVSSSEVIIFERIEKRVIGHQSNMGRPIQYYSQLFKENGLYLDKVQFLQIKTSYFFCGAIRKIFNRKDREEGEPTAKLVNILQTCVLPFTRLLDKVVPNKRDLAMLSFKKNVH